MKVGFNFKKKFIGFPARTFVHIEYFGAFGVALIEYFAHKIDQVVWVLHLVTLKNVELFINVKFQAAARLIWSRGRLGQRIKYLFIVMFAWTIFLAGGVFQGQLTEETKSATYSFLGSTASSILLESATAATYEGNTALLNAPVEHVVEESETLVSIGKKYGITIESIKFANNLTSNAIRAGQVLKIPPVEGTLHKVKKGDTIEKLARKYNVSTQTIVDFNYIDEPYTLVEGQLITIPEAQSPRSRRFYAGSTVYDVSAYGVIPYSKTSYKGSGAFIWPISGVITQHFSSYHPAIDIANSSGAVLAADKGIVVRAGWWQGGYGNAVQIDHGNGHVTTYAHMSSISVSSGQEVEKGQKIGIVGSTGRSTGPHLHFTIQYKGRYINPLSLL